MFLTEKAYNKIKDISLKENLPPIVRAGVKGGGCSGYQFVLYFEEENEIKDTDQIFEIKDAKVVIDMLSYQFLENSTIDYVEKLLASGFKFENAAITQTCGCGKSFTF